MEQACADCMIHHTAVRGHYRHVVSQDNHFKTADILETWSNIKTHCVMQFCFSFFLHSTNTQKENLLDTE